MQDSSFLKLFDILEKKEIRLFQKYMNSMYEDQKTALQVLDYFVHLSPKSRSNKNLTIERAYSEIFGRPASEDKSDRKNLQNTLSDLHLWLKEFLMYETLRNNKFCNDLVWILTVTEDKRLSKENIKVRKMKQQVKDGARTDAFDNLKGMVANYLMLHRTRPDMDIEVVQQMSTDLDGYYLLIKVKAACEIANTQNLNPREFSEILPDALISMIRAIPVARQPLLRIYLDVYHLLIYQTDGIYEDITNQLIFFFNHLPAGETQQILRYLINFASRKTKEGVETYWLKSHELNKLALDKAPGFLYRTLTPTQYLNMITAAVQAKDFDWAENFREENRVFLADDIRSETMLLARAIIVFGKKDFKTAKKLLVNAKFGDILSEVRAKTMLLMVDYELADDPFRLLTDCIKFEMFLLRHDSQLQKIAGSFRSFSRILKMLIKCRDPQELLLKKLIGDDPIISRAWLMEKARAYQQKFFRKSRM